MLGERKPSLEVVWATTMSLVVAAVPAIGGSMGRVGPVPEAVVAACMAAVEEAIGAGGGWRRRAGWAAQGEAWRGCGVADGAARLAEVRPPGVA